MNYKLFFVLLLLIFGSARPKLYAQEVLDLKKCIEMAIEQNINIKKSQVANERAGTSLLKSKMSVLPSLNSFASQSFSFGNSLDYTTYEYVKDKTSSNYFQLNSEVTIFQGFNKINTIKSEQFALEGSMYNYENIRDQIILQVASAYLNILMNAEQVAYANEQINLTKSMLEKTQVLVEVGQETKSKLLELNAELANNELALVEASNKLEQSYLLLKQLLNWDMSKSLSISKQSVEIMSLGDYSNTDIEQLISKQLQELPQIKKAKAELQSATYSYKATKALYYPSLNLQSSFSSRYSDVKNPITGLITPFGEQIDNNFGQFFSLGLNIPLFNNYNVRANVEYAKLNIKLAELNYKELEQESKNAIYEAWFNLKNAINKYNAAVKNQEAQKLLFDQSSLMYKEGLISYYEWQSARSGLNRAETNLLNTKYECIFRIKVFDYYRGVDISL